MGIFASMMLPPRPKTEDKETIRMYDAVDRALTGHAQISTIDRGLDFLGEYGAEVLGVESQSSLLKEKSRLEIEKLKRQLGKYQDDDKYEKKLNEDGSPALGVALGLHRMQRYTQKGRRLADFLIGDLANDSIVTQFLKFRR
jgi:hypothetical protein